jgi:hypothetical protein
LQFTSGAAVAVNLLWDIGKITEGYLGFSIECNTATGISVDMLSPLLQIRYPTTWTAYRPINFNEGVKINNNAYNIIYIVRKGNCVSFYVNGNKLLYSVSNDMYNTTVPTDSKSENNYGTLLSDTQKSSTLNLTLKVNRLLMYTRALSKTEILSNMNEDNTRYSLGLTLNSDDSSSTDLQSIAISGADTVTGTTSTYTAGLTPSTTTQTGVTWSIVSGSDYASIDSSTGLLTIKSGASNSSVTIQATSTANAAIVAIKKITVTYQVALNSLAISGSDTATGTTSNYTVALTPSNTTQTGVTWSIVSGSDYASIDSSTGVLTVKSGASNSSVTIQATSTANASIVATKVVTVTYSAS